MKKKSVRRKRICEHLWSLFRNLLRLLKCKCSFQHISWNYCHLNNRFYLMLDYIMSESKVATYMEIKSDFSSYIRYENIFWCNFIVSITFSKICYITFQLCIWLIRLWCLWTCLLGNKLLALCIIRQTPMVKSWIVYYCRQNLWHTLYDTEPQLLLLKRERWIPILKSKSRLK